ncbi:MAG TPA: cell division protein FtsZ, partial [Chloroflexota bacterium]
SAAADPEANIIFGAVVDEKIEGEIRITVIATGFDGRLSISMPDPAARAGVSTPRSPRPYDAPAPRANERVDYDAVPAFLRRRQEMGRQ